MNSIILFLTLLISGSTTNQQLPVYQVVEAEVSAYTSSEDETDDTPFITASGVRVRSGVVACPQKLEFSTEIEIEGLVYICEDRLNKRYRDQEVYDVWMSSKELALE